MFIMTEAQKTSAENKNSQPIQVETDYPGGEVDYAVIGSPSDIHNPVVIIPGFTEGQTVLKRFAETLSEKGEREVIYPDQPVIKDKKPIIDHHAEALLAIIENEGYGDRPVDIIAQSFGALVAVRAAELAKERGLKCLDAERGSNSVFIAPAGSNDNENLLYLGGRWIKFVNREAHPIPALSALTKELDPDGSMAKAGQKNVMASLPKTIKEVIELSRKENIYSKLGELGLKPHIFGYASDVMYPHKVVKTVLDANGYSLNGYSVPVDSGGIGAGNFGEFKEKTGLSGKEAKKAWAHHYRNAGHNDFLFHPERTVKAILQIWDGNTSVHKN
jgi:pimeloyl-ACP methyl ester carboxylesterase